MTAADTGEIAPVRLRLFVAVEIPEVVREAVDAAASALQRRAPDARWTGPSGWHLTLAFIGWVDPGSVEAVESACADAAARAAPFRLRLDGTAGTFSNRVLWAGIEHSEELAVLADRVRDGLELAGFEMETRPFRAHLTLARARRGASLPRGIADDYHGPTAAWTVDRLLLMRSRLRRTGARYTVHGAWLLGL